MIRVILFFLPIFLFSQNFGTISGKIIDAKSSEPLPGVNILVKGTYYGTATGANGQFRITNIATGSYDVEISMIGYK